MRAEVSWILDQIGLAFPQSAKVMDYGPSEGDELLALVQAGHSVSAIDVLGKAQIDGVAYLPPLNVAAAAAAPASFDAVMCIHLLGWVGAGYREVLTGELMRLVGVDGIVYIAAPVGLSQNHLSRKYGGLRVFSREDILAAFHPSELVAESYLTPAGVANWSELEDSPGIIDKEIVQIGLYAFRKVSAKKKGKGSASEAPPQTMEDDQALPRGWHAELVTVEEPATVREPEPVRGPARSSFAAGVLWPAQG